MNLFKAIGHFFQHVYDMITTQPGRDALAKDLAEIQTYISEALPVVKEIDALIPNKTTEEIVALAEKYGLHTVTPEMIADPAIAEAVIQKAAQKELQKVLPSVSPGILNASIEMALRVFKASKVPAAA